jgi:hypothetical protein
MLSLVLALSLAGGLGGPGLGGPGLGGRGLAGGGGLDTSSGSNVVFEFAPASGTGLPSVADLCDTYSSDITGPGAWCLRGDGTSLASGQTLTVQGAPVTETRALCSNGADCANITGQRFDGVDDAWKTPAVAVPVGDATVCVLLSEDNSAGNLFMGKDNGNISQRTILFYGASGSPHIDFCTSVNCATDCAVDAPTAVLTSGVERLVCAVYDFVTNGTSTAKLYVDGAQVGATTTGCNGPLTPSSSVPWFVGTRSDVYSPNYWPGRIRNAFVTEQVLSAATIAAMARTALADTPTGTRGEALTFTRASTKFCDTAAGSAGTTVPSGRPCDSGGGMEPEGGATNVLIRSDAFDHAAWTTDGAGVAAPVVTANTTDVVAPDGTYTAEKIVLPAVSVVGNYSRIYSTIFTGTAAAWSGSIYLRSASGSSTFYLLVRAGDSTAYHSTACTVTTTWTRCLGENKTLTAASWLVIIGVDLTPGSGQVAQAAQTVYAWGGQVNVGGWSSSYIATAGTSVTRVADRATTPNLLATGTPNYTLAATVTASTSRAWSDGSAKGVLHIGTGTFGDANGASVWVLSGGEVSFRVYDAAAGVKTVSTDAAITTGARRIRATNTGGTLALTIDGVAVAQTVSGAGTGVITTMPGTMYLGSLGNTNPLEGTLSLVCVDDSATGCL